MLLLLEWWDSNQQTLGLSQDEALLLCNKTALTDFLIVCKMGISIGGVGLPESCKDADSADNTHDGEEFDEREGSACNLAVDC